MNQEQFSMFHDIQLKLMDMLHNFCEEKDLEYYLIGGSVLGAKRHGGFIPWDFDIDIAMTRKNYDELKEYCIKESSLPFRFEDWTVINNYPFPHARVVLKNTKLVNKFAKYNKSGLSQGDTGIYIDIFPLDNAPDDNKKRKKQCENIKKIKALKKYKMAYKYNSDKKIAFVKDLIKTLIFWTNIDKINKKLDNELRRYNNQETECICSMTSHYSYEKQCMPKGIYGTPILAKFEDKMFYIPEKNEEYLTRIYKDYMTLPPESERKANLDMFENLEIFK